jgi:YbbR domain-containing protein
MDFRKILFDNWSIKLISLGFSIALWFYVTSTGKTEMTLTVPLELRNIPQGMTVVGDVTSTLEVRVQGQERVLRDSAFGKKVAGMLDLSIAREGENTVRISPDDIKRPDGVMVSHLSVPEVKVKLEPLVKKTFRLRPVLHGAPAAGYRLTGITVTPVKITVEGPSSVMKTLGKLETMPIDIQGSKESLTLEPKIDYQGQPVKLLEKNIVVRVNIERTKK